MRWIRKASDYIFRLTFISCWIRLAVRSSVNEHWISWESFSTFLDEKHLFIFVRTCLDRKERFDIFLPVASVSPGSWLRTKKWNKLSVNLRIFTSRRHSTHLKISLKPYLRHWWYACYTKNYWSKESMMRTQIWSFCIHLWAPIRVLSFSGLKPARGWPRTNPHDMLSFFLVTAFVWRVSLYLILSCPSSFISSKTFFCFHSAMRSSLGPFKLPAEFFAYLSHGFLLPVIAAECLY